MLALSQLLLLIPTGVEGLSASNACGRWPAPGGGMESFVMLTRQADHATAGRAQMLKQNGFSARSHCRGAARSPSKHLAVRAACAAIWVRCCIDRERTTERLCTSPQHEPWGSCSTSPPSRREGMTAPTSGGRYDDISVGGLLGCQVGCQRITHIENPQVSPRSSGDRASVS